MRGVGGLKDTVLDLAERPDCPSGFVFELPDSTALLSCVQRALLFYHEYPKEFAAMQKRAMNTRFTWDVAADEYVSLYQLAAHS